MKISILLFVTLFFGLSGFAIAADDGAIKRGAAKAFYCTDCHGYNGMGTTTNSELAGLNSAALEKILLTSKKGKSSMKQGLLKNFSDSDIHEIAAYFGSLKKTGRGEVSYARDIGPIISIRCAECHSSEGEGKHVSGLDMTHYDGLMKGTQEGGKMITPGSAINSSFMVMVTRKDHLRMPYGKSPLSDDEVRVISKWINQGAKNN
ncbi:MAG: hypothetical protein L3J70_09845 [Gammaproteobacteria bacterium]|nr:hypothetical protein [Gammaproteobacteria bacterium]